MAKKILPPVILMLFALFLFPSVLAIDLEIEKLSENEVLIYGLDRPAKFNLSVTNKGLTDNFKFFNLLGFRMTPIGTVPIEQGQTKDIEILFYPREDFDERGFYTFQYHIQGQDFTEQIERLTLKIISLEDAFEIGAGDINPQDNSLSVYIQNKENFDFGEINVTFSSPFFNLEEVFPLGPNERKNFTVKVNKEDFKKLIAGFYTMNAKILIEDQEGNVEGVIKFLEQDIVTTEKKEYGLFINTQIITKKNEGNTINETEIIIQKNIISRLFTTFSPTPDSTERQTFRVSYTWKKEVKPGESLEVIVRTNWFFPLLIIFFIVVIVVFVKKYSETNLMLRKKVTFVKAKGGEFALKVSITLHARNYVERVSVIDRLPPLVKIHERFGAEYPKKIDEKNRRIEWDFEKLEAGEVRILTYIIYSRIGVIGKFALPSATAVYEKEGSVHESFSNRAFFVAEQSKEEEEE